MAFCVCNKKQSTEVWEREVEEGKALLEASSAGDVEQVARLLKEDVSVNAEAYNRNLFYKSQNYQTPLHRASANNHPACVRLLIEAEADLDATDRYDITAVHLAAENGNLECLQILLDAGAKYNTATKHCKAPMKVMIHVGGTTPLHLATKNNHIRCIRELILNGADYNATDELGRTSLYIASELGLEGGVIAHLDNAISRTILSLPVEGSDETPLHQCVRHGMQTSVVKLLTHGSDVNHRNNAGSSPLHLALHHSENFSLPIVKALIRHGYNTDINLRDNSGTTPLQYVCFGDNAKRCRRPHVAAYLIAYGAEFMSLKNKHGISLLLQELRGGIADNTNTLLQAMTDGLEVLPSLKKIGILVTPRMQSFQPDWVKNKTQWYSELAQAPRTLQHISRCQVRRSLGTMGLRKVHTLPIPRTLMEYLLLNVEEDMS